MDPLKFVTRLTATQRDTGVSEHVQISVGGWGCHQQQHGVARVPMEQGCKTCRVVSLWSVPYGTCFMDTLRTHRLLWSRVLSARKEGAHSEKFLGCKYPEHSCAFLVFFKVYIYIFFICGWQHVEVFQKRERIKWNWRRELTLNFLMFHEVTKPYEQEKNARVKVVFQHPKHDGEAKWTAYWTHRQRKSNLLKVAVLNKCQSENAASLFKSIRGLGLTVSGGRSPLLWGWGDFFFFLLTKVLSIPIRWHPYRQLSLATTIKDKEKN